MTMTLFRHAGLGGPRNRRVGRRGPETRAERAAGSPSTAPAGGPASASGFEGGPAGTAVAAEVRASGGEYGRPAPRSGRSWWPHWGYHRQRARVSQLLDEQRLGRRLDELKAEATQGRQRAPIQPLALAPIDRLAAMPRT